MACCNLPDNVSPNDPTAPWNQVERPTRVSLTINYQGVTATFESEWDYCPTEEEVLNDFLENYAVEVNYPDD